MSRNYRISGNSDTARGRDFVLPIFRSPGAHRSPHRTREHAPTRLDSEEPGQADNLAVLLLLRCATAAFADRRSFTCLKPLCAIFTLPPLPSAAAVTIGTARDHTLGRVPSSFLARRAGPDRCYGFAEAQFRFLWFFQADAYYSRRVPPDVIQRTGIYEFARKNDGYGRHRRVSLYKHRHRPCRRGPVCENRLPRVDR